MLTILRREIAMSMASLLAYVSIIVFLTVCGLVIWIYPDSNLLDAGYASMQGFFDTVPWIFIFLVPAITMRLFSDEKKSGTLETLVTRPLTDWQIILGKYLSACFLVLIALIPTFIYVYSIYELADPLGNVDGGAIIGSYIGLFLLGAVFSAIGLFASAISTNQVIAFMIAVLFCFFSYSGFESISKIASFSSIDSFLIQLGISAHYQSISRGVLDTRDLVYFISFSALFLYLTKLNLESRKW